MARGGKRPGAGRPPSGDALVGAVGLSLTEAQLAYVENLAEREHVGLATIVRRLVAYAIKTLGTQQLP